MKRHSLWFLADCAVIAAGAWPVLRELVRMGVMQGYSYIVLLPIIAAYLFRTESDAIFAEVRYSRVGFAIAGILAAGVAAVEWMAPVSAALEGTLVATGIVTLLAVFALFAGSYGVRAARASAYTFIFILLMVPVPTGLMEHVIGFLQSGSTSLSHALFNMLGVPVLRQDFTLILPGVTIEVAKECSGINSTIALLITVLLIARLSLRSNTMRLILLAAVVPLSITKNAIRIVTLTMLALRVNPSFLNGKLHHDGGIVFYLLALALLAPVVALLRKAENGRFWRRFTRQVPLTSEAVRPGRA